MTPDFVPETFEHTMGCTAADLLRALPLAFPGGVLQTEPTANRARVDFPDGQLQLAWLDLPARKIALLEIPRLQVIFRYARLPPDRRREVQRRFDLTTQRGGG